MNSKKIDWCKEVMTLLKKDSQMVRRSFDILHVQNGAQCFATLYCDLQSVVCGAFLGLIELNGQKDLLESCITTDNLAKFTIVMSLITLLPVSMKSRFAKKHRQALEEFDWYKSQKCLGNKLCMFCAKFFCTFKQSPWKLIVAKY